MAAKTEKIGETPPAPEESDSDPGSCDNCEKPAVVETDGVVANKVRFCEDHLPDNMELPAKAENKAEDE